MLTHNLWLLIALTDIMTGLGAFLLCLAALDLLGAAVRRLWLTASPAAAQQARLRAALAGYRDRARQRMRRKP